MIDPISTVEPIIETPKNHEENVLVSANTRSAQTKKMTVVELEKMLAQGANLNKRTGQSGADPCDSKKKRGRERERAGDWAEENT